MRLRIAYASKTPIFWGSKHFLMDLRLRPGSMMRDRSVVYNGIKLLLEEQTPKLRREPAGLAYVSPENANLRVRGSHAR